MARTLGPQRPPCQPARPAPVDNPPARRSGRCLLCGVGSATAATALCRPCRAALPWLRDACRVCALPAPAGAWAAGLCPRCRRAPGRVPATWSLLRYAWPVPQLVCGLKFNGRLQYAALLGELLAAHWPALPAVDLVVPMPLHRRRLRSRGFNQAVELLRPAVHLHRAPVERDLCRRTRDTPAQSRLDAAARRRNVRGAFVVHESLRGERVAIFDDVITTGASGAELARCLRRAGASEVRLWSLARAYIVSSSRPANTTMPKR